MTWDNVYTFGKKGLDEELNKKSVLELQIKEKEKALKILQDVSDTFIEQIGWICSRNNEFGEKFKLKEAKRLLEQHSFIQRAQITKNSSSGELGANVAGAMSGAGATVGIWSLIGTFGTASTGIEISALHGAAAYSSILATLGGGATTVGGFGMLGGQVALGGLFACFAIPGYLSYKNISQMNDIVKENKQREDFINSNPTLEQIKYYISIIKEAEDFIMKKYTEFVYQEAMNVDNAIEEIEQKLLSYDIKL